MTDKVVDASAIASILFFEPSRAAVEKTIAGAILFAPTLLRYEIANVCLKKMRARPAEQSNLLTAFRAYGAFGIHEMDVDLADAISLAAAERLSIYDASYLWLARNLSAELVTLDSKLARAAKP